MVFARTDGGGGVMVAFFGWYVGNSDKLKLHT